MKKTNRTKVSLTKTTVRALVDGNALAAVAGGISQTCIYSQACYTKPAGGGP